MRGYKGIHTSHFSVNFSKKNFPLLIFSHFLGTDRRMIPALYLFHFLRSYVGSKVYESDHDFLQKYFSTYQIRTYLARLKQAKLLRPGENGSYYLQGYETIERIYGIRPGVCRKMVSIPEYALASMEAWKGWVSGLVVKTITSHLRSKQQRPRTKSYSAESFWNHNAVMRRNSKSPLSDPSVSVETRMTQGVALSLIQRAYGVSAATASRLRRRGQSSGYTVERIVEYVKSSDKKHIPAQFINTYRRACPEARVFPFNGKVAIECPSLITFQDGLDFLWKTTRKTRKPGWKSMGKDDRTVLCTTGSQPHTMSRELKSLILGKLRENGK